MRKPLFLLILMLNLLLISPQAEAWSPRDPLKVCLNVFILGDTGTELERDAQFPSSEALLGDPDSGVRELIETAVEQVEGIWMQCCIGFKLNLVKVIRTQKLMALGRPLRDYLNGPGNAIFGVREALKTLKEELERQGLKLSRYNCLHIFVGWLKGWDGVAAPEDVISFVSWVWRHTVLLSAASWIMAHEIGHNFGLNHVNEPGNLMGGGRGGRRLQAEQCAFARLVASGIVFGRPPEVQRIEFPTEIPADGTEVSGKVFFVDWDGDVNLIRFDLTKFKEETDFKPFAFDPQVAWKRFGPIKFSLSCSKPQDVILKVTLEDEAGHVSAPAYFSFTCV